MRRLTRLAIAALAVGSGCAQAADTASLRTDRLGNLFAPGEPVRFEVSGGSGPWAWTVLDWQGEPGATGKLTVKGGRGELELPAQPEGYLELVAGPAACGEPCAARAAFAVVPRARELSGVFGVMTHVAHGWAADFVPILAHAGIGQIRDEHYWAALERAPGQFAYPDPWSAYMAELAAAGIEPLLALTFANPLYDNGTTPASPDALAAYGRYAATLAGRYRGQLKALEVWNEINGHWCDGECPKDRAAAYMGLLDAAWQALKATAPEVMVVGGATAGIPIPFWRRLAERGAFARMDVASVHSYRDAPEGSEQDIAALRALMRRHGAELPIWVTETGSGGPSPEQRRDAAMWLVKQLALLRSADAARVYWYLLRDYDPFDGLGLIRKPDSAYGALAPNPALVAYATLIRTLGDARPVRREPGLDLRTRIYLFDRGGSEVRVLWSSSGTSELSLEAGTALTRVDIMGRSERLLPEGGRVTLRLDGTPLFILGAVGGVSERRPDRLLADSVAEFAVGTGEGAWRYGLAIPPAGSAYDPRRDFQPLQPRENDWADYWGDPRWPYLAIGADMMHPGVDRGRPVLVVRRWQAPAAGIIEISGRLAIAASQGDGTEAMIVVDGRKLAGWALPPGASESYAIKAGVGQGSTVDLVLSPGAGGNDSFDATTFTAAIVATGGSGTQ